MEVWILELHIFNHNKSLISSQDFPDIIASVIKVHGKPLDFALESLVLLSKSDLQKFQCLLTNHLVV